MKYGHFSQDGLEYVVTTPNTPRPWINYLTNENYCSIISQTAGGYSFYKDCRDNRITRWLPENWHFDRPGRYIFLRDADSGDYWSPTYQPMRRRISNFSARHGLGYTTISSKRRGIAAEISYFVPEDDSCELWLASITNQTKQTRTLEAFPYVEWLLGDYHQELRYRNIMNLYNRVWFDQNTQAIFAKKTAAWGETIQNFTGVAFFASSLSVTARATRKNAFLGKYNTEANPDPVVTGKFQNIDFCSGEDGIGCLRHRLTLKPGQTKQFVVIMGQTDSFSDTKKLIKKYRKLSQAKQAFKQTKQLWQKRILDNIWIKTPDRNFDLMMNIWVKYQMYICNFWSRSPSFYHEGSGGRGYRDSCQDSEAIASINSEITRSKILTIAPLIRKDGTSAPGFVSKGCPQGHRPNKDHQVWLTSTVFSYIKETGDKNILLKKLPFLRDQWIGGWHIDKNFKGRAYFEGNATLFEHLERNLNFCFRDTGERGLPLIGHADWNDAIDSAGKKLKGESVWLAQALVRSLKMLAQMACLINKDKQAKQFLRQAQVMTERINRCGWDGEWYSRGFTDCGSVYGSNKNEEGKIYLNSQSWAILSGVAEGNKLKSVLNSVDKYLDGKYGLALFYPAYSKFNPRLGRISMFAEGTKENAAVFCHAAAFMAVAYCLAGEGDKAYQAMKKVMPNNQIDYALYKTEPYVYAEYLAGPQHPYLYGEGAFTWITGASGWSFICGTEYLLGIKRELDGLRIDPCIPKHWRGFKIRRAFRGAIYEIEVKNPKRISSGIERIFVEDHGPVDGNMIPAFSDGKVHKVKVTMG